jgi:hypothetical protein
MGEVLDWLERTLHWLRFPDRGGRLESFGVRCFLPPVHETFRGITSKVRVGGRCPSAGGPHAQPGRRISAADVESRRMARYCRYS